MIGIFLSNLKDETVIENLLTPPYHLSHNLLTFIPDAWNEPLEYYEKHIGTILAFTKKEHQKFLRSNRAAAGKNDRRKQRASNLCCRSF